MEPPSGRTRPAMIRISVVLPAPSGPTRPVIAPGAIEPETASSAGAPGPKRLVIASIRTSGPAMDHAPPVAMRAVTGIPWRRPRSRSSTMTRIRYTRSVRSSGVSTDFGVNSAVGEMKPT